MIRRPLLFVSAGFVSAVLISYYSGIYAALAAAGACAVCVFYPRRKAIAWLLLISYCAGFFCFGITSHRLDNEETVFTGSGSRPVSIEGTIGTCEKKTALSGDQYTRFVLKNESGSIMVRYYGSGVSLMPDMRAKVCGTVERPSVRRNPGCFNYSLYLRSLGITAVMTAENVTVADENSRSLRGRIFAVRENFMNRLEKHTDRSTAAMIRAIMFGDKGELDEDTLQVFQKNGTAHILAVSGLHIGIIYGFLLKLWRWRKGRSFFVFTALFFGMYAAMADFSPSVIRAVCMIMLHVFAGMSGRKYDLNNAAFLVVLGVLAYNPYMLFNTGFQMSLLAVLTMSLVMPFVRSFYGGMFLASLVVQIGLGPFIVYSFNYMSIISVFINVPVVALAGMIVPLGLAAMALEFTFLFGYAAMGTEWLCRILVAINEAAEISGITTFQLPSPPLWMMAFYYLSLLTFATEEGRLAIMRAAGKGVYIVRVAVFVTVFSLAFAAFAGDGFEKSNLTFVDVGQGDCMCVQTDGGILQKRRCYLIDGGGNVNYNVGHQILRSYLLKNGISHVDGAFVTHRHTDHYRGICELAAEGMVDRLYVYEGNRLKAAEIAEETGLPAEKIEYLHGGQNMTLGRKGRNGNEIMLEVLWPAGKTEQEYEKLLQNEENENAMSLIFRLVYSGSRTDTQIGTDTQSGRTSILITGDMGEEGEAELLQNTAAASGVDGAGRGVYSRVSEGDNTATASGVDQEVASWASESKNTATASGVDADILKVGHHGSRSSSSAEFLDAVSPEIAVIQVGKNNYGHPAQETLDRLRARNIPVYRNDECGAIGFEIRHGKIEKVRRMVE